MLRLLIKILIGSYHKSKRIRLLGLTFALSLTTLITVTGIDTQFDQVINQVSSESMGGNLRLSSSTPVSLDLNKIGQVEMTHVIRMPTVTFFNGKAQMLTLNAIEENYPVVGSVKRVPASASLKTMEVWIQEPLSRMKGLNVGDMLPIGKDLLRVTGIVQQSPGQRPLSLNLAPDIWVSHQTLSSLGLLMPASRAQHLYYFHCTPSECRILSKRLEPILLPGQKLTSQKARTTQIDQTTEQYQRLILFLGFISCLAALVALLYSSYQYIDTLRDALKILMQLGIKSGQTINGLCISGCIFFIPIAFFSLLLSHLLQLTFTRAMAHWVMLPPPLMDFSQTLTIVIMLVSLVILVVIPYTLQALNPSNKTTQQIAIAICLLFFYACLSQMLKSFLAALIFIGGLCLFLALLTTLFFLLVIFQKRAFKFANAWSFITQAELFFYRARYAFLLSTYTLLTATCLTAASISFDSIQFWSQQLNTPSFNYFAINIPQSSLSTLKLWFADKQIKHTAIYPMIKARLVKKNNMPIMAQLTPDQQTFNALHRSINISYSASLPNDNTLISGRWPPQKNEWSIEQEFAKSLGLKVGDNLTFIISGEPVSGVISGIRQLIWQNMQPNFYVLGHSSSLADYPSDSIVSFLVKKPEKIPLLVSLIPSINLIDLSSVFELAHKITHLLLTIAIPFGIVTVIASILLSVAIYYGNKAQALALRSILNHLGLARKSRGVSLHEILVFCVFYSSCLLTQLVYLFIHQSSWLPLPMTSPFLQVLIIIVTFVVLCRLFILKINK